MASHCPTVFLFGNTTQATEEEACICWKWVVERQGSFVSFSRQMGSIMQLITLPYRGSRSQRHGARLRETSCIYLADTKEALAVVPRTRRSRLF